MAKVKLTEAEIEAKQAEKKIRRDELMAECDEKGIPYNPNANSTVEELEVLLGLREAPVKPSKVDAPVVVPAPVVRRKVSVLKAVAENAVVLPNIPEVPSGVSTTQDHERRLCALEVLAGLKESVEVEAD